MRILYLLSIVLILSCQQQPQNLRSSIDLSGIWQFSLDTADSGIQQNWYADNLGDSIELPGTTDLRQKGFVNTDTTTMHLNRVYKYEGPAWYRKKVVIPEDFRDKHITLFMERTKPSTVWIDTRLIGSSILLQSPQIYDVTEYMTPGEHLITIRIDNTLRLTPYGNVHIYSDDTQTNWNGIIGKLFLEATSKTYISDLQVYPDVDNKKIGIKLSVENAPAGKEAELELSTVLIENGKTRKLKTFKVKVQCDTIIQVAYELGKNSKCWDEYQQPLYKLTATLSGEGFSDNKTVDFGMRKLTVNGTQFNLNGRNIFLRGKHEACVFPMTGFPPMDPDGWAKVFKIAKLYGINHYRFHSYCPPEAAFIAADREGIYLQAELPFWGGLDSDSIAAMLQSEGFAMLKNYANHPSFMMFSHGNEIWGGHDRVEKNILAFKAIDNRPLYTMGSNNNIGYVAPRACSDFFVAARVPYSYDTILAHTRLTHAFADSRDGGILNTEIPSTEVNYDFAVSQIKIPVISHEIGQYQIYPDYAEIEKYTGVLRAWNLEVFRERLKNSGMLGQNKDFQKASGAWSSLCYKAEMEAALRTQGLAGFQLLDLQDFPGQGTALVGILDAFMDSKEVISRDVWLHSCNDVVILLKFPKYCWTANETFLAVAEVVNYSNRNITDDLAWEIRNRKGEIIEKGEIPGLTFPNTGINKSGEIKIDLGSFKDADQLRINIMMKECGYSNTYPIWVYPKSSELQIDTEILVADKLDSKTLSKLQQGGKVLLFPEEEQIKDNCVHGLFPPDFWNYGMFKGISEWVKKPVSPGTLGLLMDPKHPVFIDFPTDFHTNWQWFSIIKASNPLILDKTGAEFKPVVQVIDNLERNHKLGLIFEFRVGTGKLLVCMAALKDIPDRPEAAQLYKSMLEYMSSDHFNPEYEVNELLLKQLHLL
jgi:hypothetical protein